MNINPLVVSFGVFDFSSDLHCIGGNISPTEKAVWLIHIGVGGFTQPPYRRFHSEVWSFCLKVSNQKRASQYNLPKPQF